ncbi:WD40 repeat domain-containing protein [Kamptonema formosum]|uniref:WD40 repeat domain-containing protein n=1 Tax=Kamptonema formosum TaxID=331992 RepID=UPI00034B0494|nr:hypothetical protein [Oscillatoria sp. PCC 10802]
MKKGKREGTLTGHTGAVNAVAITLDGQKVVYVSWDGTLKIWDLNRGKGVGTLTQDIWELSAVAITPDGQKVVYA